jgi:hypothetical protein
MRQRIIVSAIIAVAFAWSLVLRERRDFRVHASHSRVGSGAQPSFVVDQITIGQLKAWARECSPASARGDGAFHVQTFDDVTPEGEEITILEVLVKDDSRPGGSLNSPTAGVHHISCMGLR